MEHKKLSFTYRVYIIHLKKEVLTQDTGYARYTAKKFKKENPHYDQSSGKPCVYVGYTYLPRQERYEQHKSKARSKKGGRLWNPYVNVFHNGLSKKLHGNKESYPRKWMAEKAEKRTAERLKKKGFAVYCR